MVIVACACPSIRLGVSEIVGAVFFGTSKLAEIVVAELKVAPEFLRERLKLPDGTRIVGAAFSEPDQSIRFWLEGPMVPEAAEVTAIYTVTCKLEKVL